MKRKLRTKRRPASLRVPRFIDRGCDALARAIMIMPISMLASRERERERGGIDAMRSRRKRKRGERREASNASSTSGVAFAPSPRLEIARPETGGVSSTLSREERKVRWRRVN